MSAVAESQPGKISAKRQHWMSVDTWLLVEERRALKARRATGAEIGAKNAAIQAAARRDSNHALAMICEELEQHSDKLQTRDLHDKVRLITRQFKPRTWAIENASGVTVTDIEDIVNVWKEYCRSLFAGNSTSGNLCSVSYTGDREPDILRDEIRAAVRHLKSNKAVGADGIPIEVFRAMGEVGVEFLYTICCKTWETGRWPEDWSRSTFIPLHKKGSTKKCNNFRLISLISHASKVLLHVINTRLQSYLSS